MVGGWVRQDEWRTDMKVWRTDPVIVRFALSSSRCYSTCRASLLCCLMGGLTSSFLLLGKMNGPLLLFLVVESTRSLQRLKSCGFTDTWVMDQGFVKINRTPINSTAKDVVRHSSRDIPQESGRHIICNQESGNAILLLPTQQCAVLSCHWPIGRAPGGNGLLQV